MSTPNDSFGGFDAYGTPPGGFTSGYGDPEPLPEPKGKGRKRRSKKEGDPKVTRKAVGVNRTLAIVFGLVVALIVFVMAFGQGEQKTNYVVRAKVAIPASQTATSENLEAVAIAEAAIEPGTQTGTDATKLVTETVEKLNGLTARYPIPQGRQLHLEDFTGEPLITEEADPNLRAMSIRALFGDAVGGILRVGDRVDIIGVMKQGAVASVVAQNVPIVAIAPTEDQINSAASSQTNDNNRTKNPTDILPTDPLPGIYTVQVPSELTTTLSALSVGGSLVLVLRAPDSTENQASVQDPQEAVCGSGAAGLPDSCYGVGQTPQ